MLPLDDLIRPQFHQVDVDVEHFIKAQLGLKLDKGKIMHVLRHLDIYAKSIRRPDL